MFFFNVFFPHKDNCFTKGLQSAHPLETTFLTGVLDF